VRVILDANVLIAAVASRGLCEAVVELCLEGHHLVLGESVLEEAGEKLRGKLGVPEPIVDEYLDVLRRHAEIVETEPVPPDACRDPDDLAVLGLVNPGRADMIVTGDKDLLVLGRYGTVRIVTPRGFWEAAAKRG